MNDLDHDLREMFRRREGDVLIPASVPAPLLRRTKRRQVATSLAVLGTVIALSTAALFVTSDLRDRPRPHTVGAPATTRTLIGPGVAVTIPTDWFVTTYEQRPAVVVTNFDPDLRSDDPCAAMPDDGVLLRIALDGFVVDGPGPGPWPVALSPAPGGSTACPGDQSFAAWTVPEAGDRYYSALSAVGQQASAADRETLLSVFSGMRFNTAETDLSSGNGVSALVASGSTADGRAWTVAAEPGGRDTRLHLGITPTGGGLVSSESAQLPLGVPQGLTLGTDQMHGVTFLVGGVSPDIASVQVRPQGQGPIDAELIALPPSMDSDARAFAVAIPGAARGTLVLRDSTGATVLETAFAPGVSCWPDDPCRPVAPSGADGSVATGTAEGQDWRIEERDGGLVLVVGSDVIATTPTRAGPIAEATSLFGDERSGTLVIFGVVSPEVTSVVLFSSDIPTAMQTGTLADGRLAFWGGLAGDLRAGNGQLIALDASCTVIGAVALDSGEPVTDPAATD
nr:hypothetical protein [Actinomycetota bacterium]